MHDYDVIVIGGGPAGLAAALAANENGARVLVVEREERLGGMLKQCIHDGFGLRRFGERLAGPEYVERFMDKIAQSDIEAACNTFVTRAEKTESGFTVTLVSREGLRTVTAKSLVLATGCRERSAKQVFIHGTRPAGVFTAGTAQHFTNRLGVMPTKKCVILGSGDIGLIMARRLTLEGAEVLGVYEINPTPSGLTRNIYQCLTDYNIPLHLSHTVRACSERTDSKLSRSAPLTKTISPSRRAPKGSSAMRLSSPSDLSRKMSLPSRWALSLISTRAALCVTLSL